MSWHLQDPLGTISGPFTEYDVVIKIHRREAGASFFIREGDFEAWRPLDSHPAFLEARYRVIDQDNERRASAERLAAQRQETATGLAPMQNQQSAAGGAPRGTWYTNPYIMGGGAGLFLCLMVVRACNNWWDSIGEEYRAKEAREKAVSAQREAERQTERAAREQVERERKEAIARAKAEEAAREAARTPSERASIATMHLGTGEKHTREGFCLGKKQLELIPVEARTQPDVAKAIALYYKREAQELAEVRKEAEQSRGIVCNDGSGSGCMCHGSHRGCCSHHGGIKECEPIGDVTITCPK